MDILRNIKIILAASLAVSGILCAAPPTDAMAPIVVGPRDEVGKESFSDKAVSSVLGSVLGSSGRSSGSSGPKTRRDPTRKLDYSEISKKDLDLEAGARARWTDDGLLVSTRIEESDDKGTFQTVFLENCAGERLYPAGLEVYKIWTKHSLSVSWSKTTTLNGKTVSRESGGWSDSWTEDFSTPGTSDEGDQPAVWQQVGYDRAQAGARQVGTYFSLTPDTLGEMGEVALFAHVSRPEQDPVITEPFNWIISGADPKQPEVKTPGQAAIAADGSSTTAWEDWSERCRSEPAAQTEDHSTSAGPAAAAAAASAAAKPPCIEALLRVEEKKAAYLAKLDNPLARLQAAIQAANRLGHATRAHGEAQARLAAAQASLESSEAALEAWDKWFQEKRERLEQHRLENHGSREPSWAKGSRARAERRHNEKTAGLRQQVADQKQEAADAQAAVDVAAAALDAAQNSFNQALENYRNALAGLRNAKDEFAELAIMHYRCSPCEVIASHWASAARLKDLLNQMKSMLGQARARTAAQLQQAQQQAAAAQQAAGQAQQNLHQLQNRRSQIEQEMRDAVKTSEGCLSLEPQEGWGWVNLASMDNTRSRILAEGSIQSHRSSFKGSDVRVYTRPGCLRERIENIKWSKINELNNELADLQLKLAEAEQAAIEAQQAAALAQAAADGLQAELNALDQLALALQNSGLEENTDDVLRRLEAVSEDCAGAMREAVEGIADANARARGANDRTAAAEGKRDALRRRAGRAADELDDMEPADGDEDDQDKHDDLRRGADELADDSEDEGEDSDTAPGIPDPPGSLEEAERRRQEAEDAADEAEDRADRLEEDNQELEDEVEELEDEIDALAERLREWRRYRAALAAYEDCLRKKQAAAEELAKMNEANASALQELANLLGEAADGLAEISDQTSDLGKVDRRAKKASKAAGDLSGKLERLGNAMEVLDAVLRADELSPSEKLEAMSKAFEELRQWLPEIPGVSEMLEFYNEAMKAIAGALGEIEDRLSSQWADLVIAGIADPEDAPFGIREEVKRLVKIRKLMNTLSRNCGKPPVPPEAL